MSRPKKQLIHPSLPAIYERLLDLCDLSKNHQSQLLSRGISTEMIEAARYKSMPRSRVGIASQLVKEFGELKGVPGFWLPDDKGVNAKWQLKGTQGMMIPVRNETGEVLQIKIRPDVIKTAKYLSLSSKNDPSGTGAIAMPHWPKTDKITSTIRITEGELKADIATALSPCYTVSAAGVHSWRDAADAVLVQNPETIIIAFDSDKDETVDQYVKGQPKIKDNSQAETDEAKAQKANDVGKATAKLARYLGANHHDVRIETWDEESGKGIDDVLVDGHETRLMTVQEANSFISEKLQGVVTFGWFYCAQIDRMCNYDLPDSPRNLKTYPWAMMMMCEENTKPLESFMLDPASKKYENLVYLPKQDREIIAGSDHDLPSFNVWAAHSIKSKEGDVSPLLNHIKTLLPNDQEAFVLERYLAWLIGREGEKLLWMVLMHGQEGVGKSFFGELLKACLGKSKISEPSNSDVAKDWGGWAQNCSVVVMDEFDVGSSRNKSQVMDKMKMLITQERISIELKGRDAYYVDNLFNIIAFTNKDRAAWISDHDRRYFYVELAERPSEGSAERKNDDQRMADLWDWLRTEDGVAAVIYWAENYDHSWMEAHGIKSAPITESKRNLIKDNRHPVQQWVDEGIANFEHPFNRDVVSTRQLMRFIPRSIGFPTETSIGMALKKAGALPYKNLVKHGIGNRTKARLKILREHERYEAMSMDEIRAVWLGDTLLSADNEADTLFENMIDEHANESPKDPLDDDAPI